MHCEVEQQTKDREMLIRQVLDQFARIIALVKWNKSNLQVLRDFNALLEKIKTPKQAISFIKALTKAADRAVRSEGKIRVQPTSIAKRRKGLPRGVKTGRPSALKVKKRGLRKRPRHLSQATRE
jgi:hypothetical protein